MLQQKSRLEWRIEHRMENQSSDIANYILDHKVCHPFLQCYCTAHTANVQSSNTTLQDIDAHCMKAEETLLSGRGIRCSTLSQKIELWRVFLP